MASLESETETFSVEGPDLWEWYITHLKEWVEQSERDYGRNFLGNTSIAVAEALQEYLPQMFPGRRVRVGNGPLGDLGVYFQELVTIRAGTRHHLGRAVSSHKRIETDPGVWVVNSHADTHMSLLADDDPVLLSGDRLSMIDRCGWCFLSALLPSARRSARERGLHYPNNAGKRRGFLEKMKPTTSMFTRGKAIR